MPPLFAWCSYRGGMKQMGYKNRYFHNWLEWLHKVSIEGNAGKRLAEERQP